MGWRMLLWKRLRIRNRLSLRGGREGWYGEGVMDGWIWMMSGQIARVQIIIWLGYQETNKVMA